MLSMVLFVSDTGMGNVPHVDGDDAPPPPSRGVLFCACFPRLFFGVWFCPGACCASNLHRPSLVEMNINISMTHLYCNHELTNVYASYIYQVYTHQSIASCSLILVLFVMCTCICNALRVHICTDWCVVEIVCIVYYL